MLLENDRGICPWCKQGTAFRQVHGVHYATPKYGGSSTFRQELEGATRTGVLIYQCMHCDKSVVLLETEMKMPSVESDADGVRIWRSMVSPHESPS